MLHEMGLRLHSMAVTRNCHGDLSSLQRPGCSTYRTYFALIDNALHLKEKLRGLYHSVLQGFTRKIHGPLRNNTIDWSPLVLIHPPSVSDE